MPEKVKNKTLVLIDGHALVHRAYHALPPLNTGSGELVNAVFGFSSILLKTLKDLAPDYIAATFDLAGPTFRHKEFEEYKATRVKAPDELYAQIGRVKDVLKAFNIPVFESPGFEADDLIGTIAKSISNKQSAVNNKNAKKEKIKVIIVTGDLDTLQLVDDNISVYTLKKGVKETMLYDAAAVAERFEGLSPGQMNDYKGLKGDPSDNIPGVPGVGEKTAIELLKKYGTLEKLYKEVEKQTTNSQRLTVNKKHPSTRPAASLRVNSKKLLEKLLEFKEQAFFSKYLATIKQDAPIKFKLADALTRDFDKEKVIKLFKELGFYSLVNRLPEFDKNGRIVKAENNQRPPAPRGDSPAAAGGEFYGALPLGLAPTTAEKIEQARAQGVLPDRIYQLEKDLAPVISQMEKNGIRLDIAWLKKLSQKVGSELATLEKNIVKLAGQEFNVNSPQQLSQILFEKLGLQVKGLKKTPGKVISTAAAEIEKLKGQHKIIEFILRQRELAKLKNTYIDALPLLVGQDGRLRTSYDSLGTTTGRLSSKNPNLQNIPIRTELGNEIRKAFVAEPGHKLLSADYSQIELRVVAHLAQDKEMIRIFKEGKDIHNATAAEILGIPEEEVSKDQRRLAKVLNFGVIYGMSLHGFAEAAGVDLARAKEFIKKYFAEFNGVARFIDKIKKDAARDGFVQTLFGRKRFIPEINSSAWNLKQAAERMAINMPVQGCLPWKTKILTSEGYKCIGDIYEGGKEKPKFVWDGSHWSEYAILNRGEAQLAEINFSNGQIFQCDIRHEVLITNESGYEWKHFSKLRPGMRVCFGLPKAHKFRKARKVKFNYEPRVHNGLSFSSNGISSSLWYWLGYYFGDGYFYKKMNRVWCYYLVYYFGIAQQKKAGECINFFQSLGLNPQKRINEHKTKNGILSKRIEVAICSKGFGSFLEKINIKTGKTAKTKRLPEIIFSESLENRSSFIRGLVDSDGYLGNTGRSVPNLHLCQRLLLADIQLLLRTLGLESNLRGPFCSKEGLVSFRLDMPRRALFFALKLNKKIANFSRFNNKSAPKFLLSKLISCYPGLKIKDFQKRSDYILYRRWANGGTSSVYHLADFLENNKLKLDSPLYAWHKIEKIRRLRKRETTYTLSLANKSHRFDSEGIISKNTAADLLKIAMVEVDLKLKNEKVKMLLQVHDELVFEVGESEAPRIAKIIEETMENIYELAVPLKVDIEAGENWGEMNQLIG